MSEKTLQAQDTVLGKVSGIQGEVKIKVPGGVEHVAKIGEELVLGTEIYTLGSSIVVLKLDGHQPVSLGHDETVVINQPFLDGLGALIEGSVTEAVNFELLAQALESGDAIDELLPATAAGGSGGSGNGSASGGLTRLEFTGDSVNPNSGFETNGLLSQDINSFIENRETFNFRPYTTGLPDVSVNEDLSVSLDISVAFFDDNPGQTLSFTVGELPDGLTFDADTGVISGAATNDAAFTSNGEYVISVTATDDSGAANNFVTTQFVLNVNNVNDLPTVGPSVELGSNDEDVALVIDPAELLENAEDIDLTDVLVVSEIEVLTGEGSVNQLPDGTFEFVPTENWHGDASFEFVVSDGNGGEVVNTAYVTVNPVNDAPIASESDLGSTPEDQAIVITQEALLENASDVDGDALTAENVQLTSGNGTLTDNSDGTWTFMPDANWFGDVEVSFDVNDGTTTVSNTAVLGVTSENDSPEVSVIDLGSIVEDGSILIDQAALLAGASDIDGDALTAENIQLTSGNGDLSDNGDGTWTFTPDANWFGDVEVSFDVNDGTTTVSNTAALAVTSENDEPEVSAIDLGSIAEDGAIVIDQAALLAGASDIDGDALTAENVQLTSGNGDLTNNGDGTWTFTPDANWFGDVALSFDVNGGTTSVPNTAELSVTAENDAPEVVAIDLGSIAEDGAIVIDQAALLAGASDIDGDALIAENVQLTSGNGDLADNGDGTWTFTPDANWFGDVALSFDVNDGTTTVPNSAALAVTSENDAPEVSAIDLGSIAEDGSILIDQAALLAGASDIDGDALTAENVQLTSGNGDLTDNGDGTWTFTPDANWFGDVALSFDVNDGTTTVPNSAALSVAAENDAPEVSAIDLGSIVEDGAIVIDQTALLAGASDIDGDALTAENVQLTTGNGDLTDNGDGTWTFTPDANWFGDVGLSFDVNDGTTTVPNTAALSVTAENDAPEVVAIDLGSIVEDGALVIDQAALLAGASDIDGDALTAENVQLTSGNGDLTDNGDGTWTFTPDANWFGDVELSFDVNDGTTAVPNTAALAVTSENDAPEIVAIDLGSIIEDGALVIDQAALLAGASDIDGDSLTAENVQLTSGNGDLSDNSDGTWTFTPDVNWFGDVALSFDVNDGTTTVPNSAALSVAAENDAPEVSAIDLGSIVEDGAIVIDQTALLAGASDIDGDALTAENVQLTTGNGDLTDNGDGTWTFTPDANWFGDVELSFDVNDGTTTVPNSAALAVTAENDAPEVVAIDLGSIVEDGAIVIDQAALVAGASDIDGDALIAENVQLISGNGDLTDNGDGTWTFTPDANWFGDVALSFDVNDGTTAVPNTAALAVTAENDAPEVSAIDLGSIVEDGSILVDQAALLAGASDIDGDALTAENVQLTSGNGDLTDNGDGTWTFTPDANWFGDVALSFDVNDGTTTVPNSAALSVTAENDAPDVVAIDLGSIAEDGAIVIDQAALLAGASDIDGDALTAENVQLTLGNGDLSDNGDGTWTFTPDANWFGDVALSFDVNDGTTTVPNSAALSVTAENDAPDVVAIDLGSIAEDGAIVIDQAALLAGASDIDGDALTAENVQLTLGNGDLSDNGDGTWTFTPDANWFGDVELSFDVNDGTTTVPNSAALAVTSENDAPEVSAINLGSIVEDGAIVIDQAALLVGASDIDGDALTAENVQLTSGSGDLSDNGDGTWTFTPDANWFGDVELSFDVNDGTTAVPNTAALAVTSENDAPEVVAINLGSIVEDGSILIDQAALLAGASDIDGDALTAENVQLTTGNGDLTDNGDGTWTFTPDANWFGDVALSFDVNDGTTTVPNSAALAVTGENDAPEVVAIDLGSIAEDGAIVIDQAALLAGASDIDGDALTAENVQLTLGNGDLSDNGDGTWTFTPDANWFGDVELSFDVNDGTTTVPNSAALAVTSENDAPEVSAINLGSIVEDGAIVIDQAALLVGASDIDGDALTAENVQLTSGSGDLSDNGDGTWTFTPDANWFGDVELSFDVNDGTTAVPNTAALAVTSENDAPEVVAINLGSIVEDGSILIDQAALLAGASDIDGDALTAENVQLTTGNGDLTDNGDGTWTFTPDANWFGDVALSFDVNDGTTTVPNSAALAVTGENDAPEVVAIDLGSIAEDGAIVIDQAALLAGASDIDGDALTAENVQLTSGNGDLTNNGDGTWTFTPDANWFGDVALSFDVNDGTTSVPNSAALAVRAENDAPEVSAIDLGSIAEDGAIVIDQAALLAGASDIDGDALTAENVQLTSGNGDLTNNGDGTWTFTPDANWFGDVALSFDVNDGTTTVPNTAALIVTSENDLPTVDAALSAEFSEDDANTSIDLLAGASDIESATLNVINALIDGDSQGAVVLNGTSAEIDPSVYDGLTQDESVVVTINYQIQDEDGGVVDQTATVTINGADDVPVISGDDSAELVEDAADTLIASGQLTATGGDAGEDAFVAETISGSWGSLTVTETGAWTYTAENNQAAIQALNGEDESLEESFTVTNADGVTTHEVSVTIIGSDSGIPDIIVEDGDLAVTTDTLDHEFNHINNDFNFTPQDEASDASGLLAENLYVNNASTMTLTFISEAAGFNNVLGWYQVDDAGNIVNAEVVWTNPNVMTPGETYTVSGLPEGQIGFFLISNGYFAGEISDAIDASMIGDGFMRFETPGGELASLDGAAPSLFYYPDGDSYNPLGDPMPMATTFHAAYADLNLDGYNHSDAGLLGGDRSTLVIGWEDLLVEDDPTAPDWDLRDLVFSVEINSVVMSMGTVAPSLSISDDGSDLSSAQVSLVLGRSTDQLALRDADEALAESYGIDYSYDAASRTLSLTGDASIAEYEEILSSIQIASVEELGSEPRQVSFSVTDTDGNTSSLATVNLNADADYAYDENDLISGTADSDSLEGLLGNDVLIGGQGSDTLDGGAGDDTYVWLAGDEAGASVDTITSFDSGDVLDFSDVLQGESSEVLDLDNYFDFSSDGTNTTINVDVQGDGSGSDMSVVLQGVDLTLLGSDQAILQSLLDNGNLITD